MPQINVDLTTLMDWYEEGIVRGATHMTIVTDTFSVPVDQFPRYTISGQLQEPPGSMELCGKTFDLNRPI